MASISVRDKMATVHRKYVLALLAIIVSAQTHLCPPPSTVVGYVPGRGGSELTETIGYVESKETEVSYWTTQIQPWKQPLVTCLDLGGH